MSYPFLGQVLTSFTNGLLGTDYRVPGKGNIPLVASTGKSAANAVAKFKEEAPDAYNAIDEGVNEVLTDLTGSSPSDRAPGSSPPASAPSPSPVVTPGDGGVSVVLPDYLFADLATVYGMDATTAYQEALSNTSYRRAMADLKAAGLNPILAANGLQGASGVSYAQPLAQSDTAASFVGPSGRVSTGTTSGKSLHTWYKTLTNIGTVVGAAYGHPIIGSSVGGALGNLLDMATE